MKVLRLTKLSGLLVLPHKLLLCICNHSIRISRYICNSDWTKHENYIFLCIDMHTYVLNRWIQHSA